MKTFKHYITEIGDSSYPFKYEGSKINGKHHHYSIKHPTDENKDINVVIRHEKGFDGGDKHSAEVSFTRKNNYNHSLVGDMSTGESVRVFSTVHKIMRQHAESNPSVSHFKFTSDKGMEPSRQSLYRKFTSKSGGSTDSDGDETFNNHIIPAKNL